MLEQGRLGTDQLMCLGAATLPWGAIEGCLQAVVPGVSKAADLVQPGSKACFPLELHAPKQLILDLRGRVAMTFTHRLRAVRRAVVKRFP